MRPSKRLSGCFWTPRSTEALLGPQEVVQSFLGLSAGLRFVTDSYSWLPGQGREPLCAVLRLSGLLPGVSGHLGVSWALLWPLRSYPLAQGVSIPYPLPAAPRYTTSAATLDSIECLLLSRITTGALTWGFSS